MGTLYIVATPIGHLGDMTQRAVDVLHRVALIAAEDTRHSRHLLQHYGIDTPMLSLHQHNEQQRTQMLMTRLLSDDVALISDAGTPLIHDPGYVLVAAAHKAGIPVVPIPGACAVIAALSASGFPADRFVFAGFLSAKEKQRIESLQALQQERRTVVLYEAPHRLVALLQAMRTLYEPDREIVLAKELTKTFEAIKRGSIDDILAWLEAEPQRLRGEFVILIAGCQTTQEVGVSAEGQRVLSLLLTELPLKKASKLTAQITGDKKNALYEFAVRSGY